MTKNNNLILVTNDTLIKKVKKECQESSNTFLFPIKDFCVGIPKTFTLEEIQEEGFIFLNRILDKEGIENFKILLKNVPQNIKGIVFDDIGILNILLETKSTLTKILFLNHANCNYESINAFLDYVDSVVISTDITTAETKEILKKVKKPLVVYAFGHVAIMYSRRTLLSNYNKHFKTNINNEITLKEGISKEEVKAIENIYGTVIYTNKPFNNLILRKEDNILYNLVNSLYLSDEEVISIINSDSDISDTYPYKYLSEEETIYRIKEEQTWKN